MSCSQPCSRISSSVYGCLPLLPITELNMESKSFEPCRIIFCFLTATVVCCAILHTPTHMQDFTLVSRLSVFSSSSANWSTNGMVISTAQPVTNFMWSLWQLAPNYRIRQNNLQPRTKLKPTKLSCWLLLLLVIII